MEYRPLGKSGIIVSQLCFGTLTIGSLAANLPLHEGAALVRAALEAGINFFDTAQYYSNYQYLAQAMSGWGGKVIIASKSYAKTTHEMAYAVEEARIALKRNKIDIFLLHEQRDAAALADSRPALEYLMQAKANGVVDAVGISTHDISAAYLAATMPEIDVLHALLNKKGLGIRGGSLEDMREALCLAKANGKGVYIMKAIGGGAFMDEAKEAIKWAFAEEEADAVAIGMKDQAELITNIAWMEGRDGEQAVKINLLERKLILDKTPACTRCKACIERCPQQALVLDDDEIIWHKEACLFCGYCIAACPWFCISFC
ncbi:MAG: aldo/keto reductase [Clostridiales bacterium]|nr:aldo/keto reductase [Clostridiales bacterium]